MRKAKRRHYNRVELVRYVHLDWSATPWPGMSYYFQFYTRKYSGRLA